MVCMRGLAAYPRAAEDRGMAAMREHDVDYQAFDAGDVHG